MSRPAIILVLLVVLPTALLSLLAGRLLRERETLLQARFELGAGRAIHDVATRLTTAIDDDWRTVRAAVADALAHRGRLSDIDARLPELMAAAPLAGHLLVFMDPLGFVYPVSRSDEPSDLVQAWRQELARPSGAAEDAYPRMLAVDGQLYVFGPVGRGGGLHVGFQVCDRDFQRRLRVILAEVAGGDMILSVEPAASTAAPVLVSDTFSAGIMPASTADPRTAEGRLTGTLPVPLDFLSLSVAWRDPAGTSRVAAWRLRLFAWGIGLLVLCVAVGGWLILRQTAVEIRRLRARNSLMMGMSHDLRTPISAMRMMAESLYCGHVRDPAAQREFLRTLITETDRLSDMAERILFFVRQEQRAVVHAMGSVDSGRLAAEAVAIYRERAALNDGTPAGWGIDLRVADGLPPVRADHRALETVLMNLIDNALLHGVPDHGGLRHPFPGVRVMVDAVTRRGRREVRLAVRDFGPGIPPRERNRVFRRFYRGSSAHGSGSGLGLALCRDIIRAHGGRLRVWSEPGRGCEFRVWLRAASEGEMG